MAGWYEVRSPRVSAVESVARDNQWTPRENLAHATSSTTVFALSQVWQSDLPQGPGKKWLRISHVVLKKRWISIIQKGKNEGGFECQITIQAKRCWIKKERERERDEEYEQIKDIGNLLELGLQRVNKHAISALFHVSQCALSCVVIFIKTIRLLFSHGSFFTKEHNLHRCMSRSKMHEDTPLHWI